MPDDGRDGVEAGPSRRPPAPFAGDQLVLAFAGLAYEDGLQDPDLTNGSRQGGQGVFVEMVAWLTWVRSHDANRELDQSTPVP